MATHDYVISNASGAAVRADLNNALAAIVSNNSNATEPSTTYSYMLWADTGSSPPVMKLRNAANDGWVTLFQLDGEWSSIAFEDGSAAAPSIYFKDSGTDTGLFSGGTDQVNVTTGGVERVEWGASEVVFNDGGENYDFRIEGDTNSSLFFVDASADAVGIGTTAPQFTNHIKQNTTYGFGVEASGDDSRFLIGNVSSTWRIAATYGSTGSFQPITFYTSDLERCRLDTSGRFLVGTSSESGNGKLIVKGYTGGSPGQGVIDLMTGARPASGNVIGQIRFKAEDSGSSNYTYAEILCAADGASSSASDVPGALVFSTTADGASSPTERFRINKDGTAIFYYLVYAPQLYNNSVTGRDVYVDSNGQLGYLSSTQGSKINIQDLGAIDWIYSLSPKSFNYRKKDEDGAYTDEFEQELEYGLIAEEVEAEAPDVCFYNEQEDGSKELAGVSYRKLIAPLIKAVQELKTENEALQARIAALEGA